jgi:hypothetical protein
MKILIYKLNLGQTKEGGTSSVLLKNARVTVQNPKLCSLVYPNRDWTREVCADVYKGGIGTCQGDSGGEFCQIEL